MKKLYILLFGLLLIPVRLFSWIGSNAFVRLCFPQSYSYKPVADWVMRELPKDWQVFYVPAGVYGIVYNPDQGIDKYQIILKDNITTETTLFKEVENHNKQDICILSAGDLIKAGRDVKLDRTYTMILRGYDLNGDSWDDTGIIQPKLR